MVNFKGGVSDGGPPGGTHLNVSGGKLFPTPTFQRGSKETKFWGFFSRGVPQKVLFGPGREQDSPPFPFVTRQNKSVRGRYNHSLGGTFSRREYKLHRACNASPRQSYQAGEISTAQR